VAYAKANPGKLDMANAGPGAQSHLAGALLTMATKVEVVHVPYKGASSVTAVMGTQSHVTFAPLPAVIGGINSGKLRPLAIGTKVRAALLPDIPTAIEGGLPGVEADNWYGFVTVAKTPKPLLDLLHGELVKALQSADVRQALSNQGLDLRVSSPGEFGAYIKSEFEKWAKVIKAAGLTAN